MLAVWGYRGYFGFRGWLLKIEGQSSVFLYGLALIRLYIRSLLFTYSFPSLYPIIGTLFGFLRESVLPEELSFHLK